MNKKQNDFTITTVEMSEAAWWKLSGENRKRVHLLADRVKRDGETVTFDIAGARIEELGFALPKSK